MSAAGRGGSPGLCFVTGGGAARPPAETVRGAIAGGAVWIQIREKDLPGAPLLLLVRSAVDAAAAAGPDRRVIVNDRLDVALAARAHGVHLPGNGLPVADVRRHAPKRYLVGRSVHAVQEARQAERDGASYVVFGPVFETPSKALFGPPQGTAALRKVVEMIGIPVWAIGGINAATIGALRGIRIAGVAVLSAIARAADPEAATREIRAALDDLGSGRG